MHSKVTLCPIRYEHKEPCTPDLSYDVLVYLIEHLISIAHGDRFMTHTQPLLLL